MRNVFGPMLAAAMAAATGILGGCSGMLLGCNAVDASGLFNPLPTGRAGEVASKAEQVALLVGGNSGFGGTMMTGYFDHMANQMGFQGANDLAGDGSISVTFENRSTTSCVFHFTFIRSADGLSPQFRDIPVLGGQSVTLDMPCSEIVGFGSLTDVGTTAASGADGSQFDNRLCVPGFLNSDFACSGQFGCILGPDLNDLNQNGDTRELVVFTSAMQQHMSSGGMGQHGMMPGVEMMQLRNFGD